MHLVLDVIVVAVILGCAIHAWRKGFIRAAFGFLPMLTALAGTRFVSPYVGKFLRGTFLFDSLSGSIRESMGLDAAIREGTVRTQTEIIEAMPLPEFLKESIRTMTDAWYKLDNGLEYLRWDCDYCNLQSDINSAEVNQLISTEQAWYLREKYLRMERE